MKRPRLSFSRANTTLWRVRARQFTDWFGLFLAVVIAIATYLWNQDATKDRANQAEANRLERENIEMQREWFDVDAQTHGHAAFERALIRGQLDRIERKLDLLIDKEHRGSNH